MLPIGVDDFLQDIAWRHFNGTAVGIEAIMDNERSRLLCPRDEPKAVKIGLEENIFVRRVHRALVFRVLARHRLKEDCLWKPHPNLFAVFMRRDEFSSRNAGHVRDDGFNLVNPVVTQPLPYAAIWNRISRANGG